VHGRAIQVLTTRFADWRAAFSAGLSVTRRSLLHQRIAVSSFCSALGIIGAVPLPAVMAKFFLHKFPNRLQAALAGDYAVTLASVRNLEISEMDTPACLMSSLIKVGPILQGIRRPD